MAAAIEEARKGIGHTSPNPAVGAVIVRDHAIIGRGYHRKAGEPHAEIEAIRGLHSEAEARGATLYVTLEPCSTSGRTPPCIDAIIRAGFSRVVIGAIDPNPAHAGRGVELLRKAGIETVTGILDTQCTELNPGFNHWIRTGRPWVIAKVGMSLDGRITRPPGEGRWITNEISRAQVHRLRARVDAIVIGAETLRTDNPLLTVRGVEGARQPWRVVLTRSGNLPSSSHLFTDAHADRTRVFSRRTLRSVLEELGRDEITSVLIEGGTRVLGEAFDECLVHHAHFYIAPLLAGGSNPAIGGLGVPSTAAAPRLVAPQFERLKDDLHVWGDVVYPGAQPAA
jgi:diaminohydroxyphosphoribosylaminopyrimidine deaminase/5-amino-6-(5-phosphoribosylamino)uracil reductase